MNRAGLPTELGLRLQKIVPVAVCDADLDEFMGGQLHLHLANKARRDAVCTDDDQRLFVVSEGAQVALLSACERQ